MTTAAEFQAKIVKAETNLSRFDGIVNGGNTLDVATDNGNVPSVAKAVKGITDLTVSLTGFTEEIEQVAALAGDGTLAAIPTLVAEAEGYKNDAAASAAAAAAAAGFDPSDFLKVANNGSDIASKSAFRTSLQLGSMATKNLTVSGSPPSGSGVNTGDEWVLVA